MEEKQIDSFFEKFSEPQKELLLPATNSFKENVIQFAYHYNNVIQPGHGLFFDFKNTPEYEKPVLDRLVNKYGWVLEKPFFIRKPENS